MLGVHLIVVMLIMKRNKFRPPWMFFPHHSSPLGILMYFWFFFYVFAFCMPNWEIAGTGREQLYWQPCRWHYTGEEECAKKVWISLFRWILKLTSQSHTDFKQCSLASWDTLTFSMLNASLMAGFSCPLYLQSRRGNACLGDLSHLSCHVCKLLKNIYFCYDKEMSFKAMAVSSCYKIFGNKI